MAGPDNRDRETRDSGSLSFHYDRDERLQGLPDPVPRRGFFFRNRSLAIVVIDLLVVFVVFVLMRLFVFTGQGTGTVGLYEARLEAFSFDGEVYVTVVVTASQATERRSGPDTLLEVTFPDGTTITDLLPDEEGESTEVRHVLSVAASGASQAENGGFEVTVTAGDDRVVLTTAVD